MKTTTSILATASIALLSISCGEKTETTMETPATEMTTVNTDNYPMTTCPVSGEKLGEMGDPHVIVHEGTTVKLCCKSCLKDFNKDPDKYISMIEKAEAK